MPGYGTASQLQRGAILPQLDRFADAALEYARRDGGAPGYAIGNSLGGCVSLRLAQRHGPDELAGIAPIAPAGLDMATWISAVEGAPLLQALLASPVPLPPQVARQIVGRLYRLLAFADPSRADPNAVSMFTQHLVERDVLMRLLANARRLRPELRAPFELARIRCPVLLIWGRRDRMVMASGAERVLEALPETRVELIDGCGHCPQVELPDRVARLLLEFAPVPLAAAA
jgi:pimeloyl-ACP methyl ester carboxylesterase